MSGWNKKCVMQGTSIRTFVFFSCTHYYSIKHILKTQPSSSVWKEVSQLPEHTLYSKWPEKSFFSDALHISV